MHNTRTYDAASQYTSGNGKSFLPASLKMAPTLSAPQGENSRSERRTLRNTSPLRRSQVVDGGKTSPSTKSVTISSGQLNSRPRWIEAKTISDVEKPVAKAGNQRYLASPCKIDYKRGKSSSVAEFVPQKVVHYKLEELPFKSKSGRTQLIKDIILAQQEVYFKKQPIGPAEDAKYQVQALGELSGAVKKFTERSTRRIIRASKANPLTRLTMQDPGDANDTADLSFDGKAMNRSDIFKIVDSFSLLPDDEEEDSEDILHLNNRSILLPEIAGIASMDL